MSKIIKEKGSIFTFLIYMVCGALCALPAIFNDWWILGWLAYTPVIAIEYLRTEDWENPYRKAWLRGLVFFGSYGLVMFSWLWELYPMDFAGFSPLASIGIIILAWLGIPLFQAVFSAFNIVCLAFMRKKRAKLWLYPISAAFVWIFLEWTQTLTWAGIPWGKLAIGQVGAIWNLQSASLFGSYFVSFLMILVAGLLAIGVAAIYKTKRAKSGIVAIICAISIFACNALGGVVALNANRESVGKISVALIQANITTQQKWFEDPEGSMEAHRELVLKTAKEDVDLIILAETALPFDLEVDKELTMYVEKMASDAKTDLIIGCLYVDETNGKIYNATRYVSAEDGLTDIVYEKQKLVPFGEYVPMRDLVATMLPFLTNINLLENELSAGEAANVFQLDAGNIGGLICFDSIYENVAVQSVRDGSEMLAISTNDCWFQDSAAVYQHNAHAILRSIETGRYVVRAANTGISSIITNRGEVIESLDPLVYGYVVGDVKLFDYNTLYVSVGNVIIVVATLWMLATAITLGIKGRNGKIGSKKLEAKNNDSNDVAKDVEKSQKPKSKKKKKKTKKNAE